MPGMHRLFFVSAVLVAAACGDDERSSVAIVCGDGTTGALAGGSTVAVTAAAGKDLRGAAITATAKTTVPSGAVSIACAPEIVLDGYLALGPAVAFGAEGTWSDRPFELTVPYKAARLPKGATRAHVRILAQRPGQAPYFPAVSNRTLVDDDRFASTATFRAGELTTYQIVAATTAGAKETQQFAWRAIVGISMGGNAAMSIALRHPDKFDIVADLVGEPGPSMVYTLGMVRDFVFGGFCTAADQLAGRGAIGTLCPVPSTRQDQFEAASDYEHMLYQAGDGVGLTLRRSLYMKGVRDMSRALSNPALYNPAHPYAPPGVPAAYLTRTAADRCANPIVLADFYDREFNPEGASPVITFCDGGDSPALGLGVFDPAQPQLDPVEIALAVDLNNNGQRDLGEPVVTNAMEPYEDVGTDGIASTAEAGYDARTNPDPARDDYHYLRNPLGTEGNGDHEAGEPYEDVGLDGVASTCQIGSTPPGGVAGCYDFGEGNGAWDISPNITRWYDSDLMVRLAALTDAQRRHIALWFDAGIRDFLNASVSANSAIGAAMAKYQLPFGVYDGFGTLVGANTETAYDFTEVPWGELPRHGYLRYGNPDASASEIMNGDGRHVGTAQQIINRATTAFAWLNQRWPEGDFTDTLALGVFKRTEVHTSPTTGRASPYAIFLPPGYETSPDARYPVVYFLHGYGQEPKDLIDLSAVFANYMISDSPLATRFQKMIIVYVDGRCRPQLDGVPVDPTGDGCERGTFYMDAPAGGTARMETNLLELMDYIDANYRTKRPSPAEITL
ncbi:MAG: alpha/beta hydrolase-fold protein [Myxococcota bacterium]|nr:alpha/beta hydrolase-fold protein [Myxococcota bacterium]